mgnify:FL=1
MPDLVSILIPTYNAEAWIASTLECAASQTWPNTEIIVVDDGSTDRSREIAEQFAERFGGRSAGEVAGTDVRVIAQENRGACAARNRALGEAQGEYIQFLDADDLMEPDKIEVQMRRLADAPPRTVAATRWARFYEEVGDGPHPPVPDTWEHPDPVEWLAEAHAGRAIMTPHGWLTPRKVAEDAGPWDEDILVNQDGEYFARVLLDASRIAFCADTATYYRSGIEGSVSRRSSAPALRSKIEFASRITDALLERRSSRRVRQASADAFQRILYQAYPAFPEIARRAEEHVRELGGSSLTPGGSRFFHWLCQIVGWKTALRLRYHYRQLRYPKRS